MATRHDRISEEIGPRVEGGTYFNSYVGQRYTVLTIHRTQGTDRPSYGWSITVRWEDGRESTHCTRWDRKRDRVLSPDA